MGISSLVPTLLSLIFEDFVKETVLETVPLTVGAAVISLLVGTWLFERFCKWWELLLLVGLILVGAGYAGTFISGQMGQFMGLYDQVIPANSHVLAKVIAYSVFAVVGFFGVYGPLHFFSSLLIGAIAPWVVLYKLSSQYEDTEKKLAKNDGDETE